MEEKEEDDQKGLSQQIFPVSQSVIKSAKSALDLQSTLLC